MKAGLSALSAMRKTTLCYLLREKDTQILLAMKKRGLGKGKWNGNCLKNRYEFAHITKVDFL